MDKKTILRYVLAIALCAALVGGFYLLQTAFVKPTSKQQDQQQKTELSESKETTESKTNTTAAKQEMPSRILPVENKSLSEEEKLLNTKSYSLVFSTKGGVVKSLKLNDYKEADGSPIEVVVSSKTGIYPFGLAFGEYSTENDLFEYSQSGSESEKSCEFKRNYKITDDQKEYVVTLVKKYVFKDDYIIDFSVSIESPDTKYIPLEFKNSMYVLNFGPQIGPGFDSQLVSNEYRKYTFFDTERRDFTGNVKGTKKIIDKLIRWVAIEGKYFIVIAYPPKDFIDKQVGFDETPIEGLSKHSSMFFDRPFVKVASVEDHFKFYIGPKKKEILSKYVTYDFNKAIENDIIWGWLIDILKEVLKFFYSLVHNWGVAIIILTVIIKGAFFPITQKGLRASMKMQGLAPKLEEIRAKYKDNPQKQQAETSALYKKEGINPLSGCLPMLIQLPFFIALYGLLNNHFELRGAMFIHGWINDLSAPEYIFTLPFSIPFITDKVRILPFLVLATQFIQQKLTPAAGGGTASQMKLMLYALPVVFFFIMYPLPSGLNLYWTVQNLLSIVNQLYNNFTLRRPIAATEMTIKKK